MNNYYDMLMQDLRFVEGLNSCMSCGICTAVCPAASFYDYDPRQIAMIVQNKNDNEIEQLLKSDTLWYCGQCMSCRPRCPRGNTPGYIIQSLRALSQRLGFFTESKYGRQQLAIKRTVGDNVLNQGYCLLPDKIAPDLHPEQGDVWNWIYSNHNDFYSRFTDNYRSDGAGILREIDKETLTEIANIFEVTGGKAFYDNIEECSDKAARKMGFNGADNEYFTYVYKGEQREEE